MYNTVDGITVEDDTTAEQKKRGLEKYLEYLGNNIRQLSVGFNWFSIICGKNNFT